MRALPLCVFFALTGPLFAETAPYAGQEQRQISSLSKDDVGALRDGAGWGLAKPAELNGWPGPLHILELADALDLSAEQASEITGLFEEMNANARALGAALIEAELALDQAFESNAIDEARLAHLLGAAETIRGELRMTHLMAHLKAAPLLTRHQRMIYARERGYTGDGAHGGHGHH